MNNANPFAPPESESPTSSLVGDGHQRSNVRDSGITAVFRNPAFLVTATVALLGAFSMCAIVDSMEGLFFFLLVTLGPLPITGLLGITLTGRTARRILAVSSMCYGGWFLFVYVVCATSTSSTAALGFLIIGLYAVPFLMVFWVAAVIAHLKFGRGNK